MAHWTRGGSAPPGSSISNRRNECKPSLPPLAHFVTHQVRSKSRQEVLIKGQLAGGWAASLSPKIISHQNVNEDSFWGKQTWALARDLVMSQICRASCSLTELLEKDWHFYTYCCCTVTEAWKINTKQQLQLRHEFWRNASGKTIRCIVIFLR